MVDILAIGSTLDSSISILKIHFLCGHGPNFGQSTKILGSLLSQAWVEGMSRYRANDDVEGTYHPMHHKRIFDWEDTIEECKMMEAMYVQAVVDSLIERSPNVLVFKTF